MADAEASHARSDALTRPIEHIEWADPRPHDRRARKRWRAAAAGLVGITAAGALALPDADAARLADPSCRIHTVTRGDTLSKIGHNYGVPLEEIKRLNPQLADPSFDRIYPADQVAYECAENAMAPARVEHVDVERFRNRWESDGVLSWESIIAELYLAGFRGDDLVTMAAISPGESGRRPSAVGDVELANGTWGYSYGAFQIRSLHAQDGTGGPRDAKALRDNVEHQAYGAFEVWRSQGFKAWTAYKLRWHEGHMGTARSVARDMGVLL